MRALLLLLALSGIPAAQAQHVYKFAKGNDVAYHSQPCSGTQRTLKQWDATPQAEPDLASITTTQAKPGTARAPRPRRTSGRTTRAKADPADVRCNAAKARREAKLKAVGLKRNFDLLRRLDDAVYEACR